MGNNCPLCDKQFNKEYILYEDNHWLIRHSEETNILGYFILQSKEHLIDLSEASESVSREYGVLLSRLMKAIRKTTDCHRIYTFSLGEAVPHYHLHVIPKSETFPRAYTGRGITSYPLKPGCPEELVKETIDRVSKQLKVASLI